jgi:hypothetical protein
MTSQINSNNINSNYPIPGVSNNTQGFRDNFSAIQTNFQYAGDEINDLQNKTVLKSALTGSILDNNMNDNLIYAVKLQDVSYTYLAITTTSGSIDIDYSAAPFQQISTTGSISLSFSNWPTSGSAGTVRVGINVTNPAHTVTLPSTVSQGISVISGVSPGTPGVSNIITFSAAGNYAFEFASVDGGNTIWIFDDSRSPGKISTTLNITNTTASTSNTTGALVVDGGVGIGGNLNIGGNLTLNNNGTLGYGVGAGGTQTQSGNKSGSVTLNKPAGEITMTSTNLAADTTVSFTLTNSTISSRDVMVLNIVGGVATAAAYNLDAVCNTGNAVISVRNITSGTLGEALVLRYVVIKGSIT